MARSRTKANTYRGYTSSDEYYKKHDRKSDRKSYRKATRDITCDDYIVTVVNKLDQSHSNKPTRHVCCTACADICYRHYNELDLSYELTILNNIDAELTISKERMKREVKEEKLTTLCESRSNQKKKKIMKKVERNGGLNEMSIKNIDSLLNDDNVSSFDSDATDSETETDIAKQRKTRLKKEGSFWSKIRLEEVDLFEKKDSLWVFKFYKQMRNK